MNNRNTAFKKGLLIYGAVLLFLVVVSQIVLWAFLSSYQKSLPETAANSFLKKADETYWKGLLTESIYGSPYSDKTADVNSAYDTYFKDKALKVRRSALESKEGYQVFKIRSDDVELGSLYLKETDDGSFGMARWKTEKLSLASAFLDKVNAPITLYLPKGAVFTVNGVSSAGKGEETESPYVTVFENKGKNFEKHLFRLPCGKQEIAASMDGSSLPLSENENGVYIFDLSGERIEQTITVPEGAEVYVNEVRLTTEYITQKGVIYPFLNPLEQGLKDAPKSTVYTVKGLYQKPALRVLYGGEELLGTEKGENQAVYAFNEKGVDYRLEVPIGAVVKVNGVDVSDKDEYIEAKDVPSLDVKDYEAELINPVKSVIYSFKGMMFVPEFDVQNADNGEKYTVTKATQTEYICKNTPFSDEILQEYTQLGTDFTVAMMEYMFFGRDYLNETFARVLSLTRKGSPAYQSIMDSYAGMYWRRQYVITYNDLHVDNFTQYADNAFSCDVHYDVTGNAVNVSRVDYAKGVYRLVFIKGAEGWEVIKLTLIDE